MSETKYMMSGGLAFSEQKDMEKLRRFSLRGWHVSHFTFLGYTLKKGERSDYIYCVDYHRLKGEDKEEYFDLFSTSGWSHVDSQADIHLFRARPGAKPIYTDRDTTVEKYKNAMGSMSHFAIPFVFITALVWFFAMVSSGALKSVLNGAAITLSVIAIPTIWTVMATNNNKWRAEGRKGLVNLVKTIPFVLLFIAGIILLFVNGADFTVNLLFYMLVGAIAFPLVIWLIMFIYHKIALK